MADPTPELAPADAQPRRDRAAVPPPYRHRTTRTGSSPTSFGVIGRIVLTLAPWHFLLWLFLVFGTHDSNAVYFFFIPASAGCLYWDWRVWQPAVYQSSLGGTLADQQRQVPANRFGSPPD